MGVLTTGNTYSTADQVTASNLNSTVNDATFQSAAVDNTSTQLSGGAIIVKDEGITQDKIAPDAVGTDQLANDVVINTSGSITGAAGSFTTLTASGDLTVDTTTLKVDSTNNRVGIGTASPTQTLDVNGQARVVGSLFVGTDDTDPHGLIQVYGGGTGQAEGGEIQLRTAADYDSTYNHYFIDAYQDDLRIGREGGADITLNSAGNVGIGTATPSTALQVIGGFRVGADGNEDLLLKRGTPAVTVGGSTAAGIITTTGTGAGSGHVGIEVPANDADDGFYIATDSNLDGTVDKLALKINALGNVGIGTDAPTAPLEVASTSGGVILPRMTTTQKNAISSPTNGEMVYDTTDNKFYGYAGGSWVAFH